MAEIPRIALQQRHFVQALQIFEQAGQSRFCRRINSVIHDRCQALLNPTQGEIAEANRSGTIWGRVQKARDRADAAPCNEPPGPALDRE